MVCDATARQHTTRDQVAGAAHDVALSVSGLVRRYQQNVGVLGVDLTIRRNEVFGLVGPNGAGKTTLISLLCGLTRPDAGTISWGRDAAHVALCPDTPEFEPWLTGLEVLRQSFGLARPDGVLDETWVRGVIADAGIADYVGRRCGGYSRGMTQRLGIAAALVTAPDVLVLDEPTSALDAAGRADVLALIRAISKDRTVMLSSHALVDVQRTADTIAVMDSGQVLFTGAPQTLIDEHLSPTWRVTLSHPAVDVVAALAGLDWVATTRPRGENDFDVGTTSLETGERNLVPALAELKAGVRSLSPVDADLETAFFALTGKKPKDRTPKEEMP